MQPSPPPISIPFLSSQTETQYPLNINSHSPLPIIILLLVSMNKTAQGTSYKWNMQYLSFCACLISLSIMSLRFIYVPHCGCVRNKMFWCGLVYILYFVYPSVDGRLGCLYLLAIVNNTAVNIGVLTSIQIPAFTSSTQKWNCWIIW